MSFMTSGKVWSVQVMMWSPSMRAFFSCGDFAPDFSPTGTTSPLEDWTRPMSPRMFSSRTVRSVTTMTESKVEFAWESTWRMRRWLSQAMVLVLPEPAECQIR